MIAIMVVLVILGAVCVWVRQRGGEKTLNDTKLVATKVANTTVAAKETVTKKTVDAVYSDTTANALYSAFLAKQRAEEQAAKLYVKGRHQVPVVKAKAEEVKTSTVNTGKALYAKATGAEAKAKAARTKRVVFSKLGDMTQAAADKLNGGR